MVDYYSIIGFADFSPEVAPLETLEAPGPEHALFLDFDGTLVDIAPTPDSIELPPDLRQLLDALCERHDGAVAIVSGRDVEVLQRHLPDFRGALIGGHGAQLCLGDGKLVTVEFDQDRLTALRNGVRAFTLAERGLRLEEKTTGVVVHFRSHPELEEKVAAFMRGMVEGDSDFTCQQAKMAYEITPANISKGEGMRRLADMPPFAGRPVLFAGDDQTDENGFEYVNELGGISIRIGRGPTAAKYQCEEPEEFRAFLRRLADMDQ
jgi:trehalose 6-phosphate phosphatase